MTYFFSKITNEKSIFNNHRLKFGLNNFKPLIFLSILFLMTIIFFISINSVNKSVIQDKNNLSDVTSTSEFSNFSNYLLSKLNSPYKEHSYTIKNNDTIEKILKKFEIDNKDIKNISAKLKRKQLSNIYSGRELSLILKKSDDGINSVVNLLFPINNTSSIEVRKTQDDFVIKENVLKLYKKEVVVKNIIKNNLYSSAINSNIEPNIIVEFARIFGFEVDFQRDIRQGDWFEIYYEKFEDENNKVKDTEKIIYASMYVNGEEINLYNFDYKNDEEYDIKKEKVLQNL